MSLEIEGTQYQAPPGTLVVFPAGVPHRNWNGGSEACVSNATDCTGSAAEYRGATGL